MSVFEYETQEDLAMHVAIVEEGRFRKHVVIEGEGGTGKTETVKTYFPWDDAQQERYADRFRAINRLEEEIEQIQNGELLLPLGLDADDEIEDREEQIVLLRQGIPSPCHYWYTGDIYPKGFFLLLKELGRHFDYIIFNDATFKNGAENLFLNALEKPGGVERTCRWTNGQQTLRATVKCQIILITNEFHARDTVRWRAVESRVDMLNYYPSIKALLRYAAKWLDDGVIMERLYHEFERGHIHGLNLRIVVDAARLRAVGRGPKDGPMGWETMLKRAISAHSVEHVPSDPEAVIRYVRERGNGNLFSSGELRKNISRFHGTKPDKHEQLPADKLEDALKWLREKFQIRQVRPERTTKGAGRGHADLWQLLSQEERQDYKRKMKEEETADKAAADKADGEFREQKALPAPAAVQITAASPPEPEEETRVVEPPTAPSRVTTGSREEMEKADAELARRAAARAAKLAAARKQQAQETPKKSKKKGTADDKEPDPKPEPPTPPEKRGRPAKPKPQPQPQVKGKEAAPKAASRSRAKAPVARKIKRLTCPPEFRWQIVSNGQACGYLLAPDADTALKHSERLLGGRGEGVTVRPHPGEMRGFNVYDALPGWEPLLQSTKGEGVADEAAPKSGVPHQKLEEEQDRRQRLCPDGNRFAVCQGQGERPTVLCYLMAPDLDVASDFARNEGPTCWARVQEDPFPKGKAVIDRLPAWEPPQEPQDDAGKSQAPTDEEAATPKPPRA